MKSVILTKEDLERSSKNFLNNDSDNNYDKKDIIQRIRSIFYKQNNLNVIGLEENPYEKMKKKVKILISRF